MATVADPRFEALLYASPSLAITQRTQAGTDSGGQPYYTESERASGIDYRLEPLPTLGGHQEIMVDKQLLSATDVLYLKPDQAIERDDYVTVDGQRYDVVIVKIAGYTPASGAAVTHHKEVYLKRVEE